MLAFPGMNGFQAVAGDVDAIPHLVEQPQSDLLIDNIVVGQEQVQGETLRERAVQFVGGNDLPVGAFGPAHDLKQDVVKLDLFDRLGQPGGNG